VLASRDNAGALIDGQESALSADGRYLAFVTDSPNAHDGTDQPPARFNCINPNNTLRMGGSRPLDFSAKLPPERPDAPRTVCQVVMRDLILDQSNPNPRPQSTLVSVSDNSSAAGRFESFHPSVSGDGGRVGFDSEASDLLPQPDANETTDAFVRILAPGVRNTPHDFGTVEINKSSTQAVQLSEDGQGPLVIEQITSGGTNQNDFAVGPTTCIGQVLHQNGTCIVSVTFSPKAIGARNGLLVIQVRGGRTFRVTLIGQGGEPPKGPAFTTDRTVLDFGQRLLLSNGPALSVTVTNTGDQPLVITKVGPVAPSAPGDYTISGNTCATVAPKAQCTVSVKFSPTLTGDRPALLQFDDNAHGPHLVGLRGQGGPMAIQTNPGIVPGGRVTSVLGTGFPPGKTVTVTFQQRPGQSTATVAADGTFRASLLVFPKASPETRTVVATVDGSPALFATTPLLIVFDTVKPADFVIRH
jgi:hypothetical protein